MATRHINNQVQTTATLIVDLEEGAGRLVPVTIYNGHSASIFVGDKTITATGATIGRTIAAASSQTFYMNGGDQFYAISAAQTAAGVVVVTYSA